MSGCAMQLRCACAALALLAAATAGARDEQVGDSYTYRTMDIFSRVEDGRYRWRVTAVEPGRLVFDDGNWITDRLGNDEKIGIGAHISGMGVFLPSYDVGATWQTRYRYTRADGAVFVIDYTFTVAGREQVTVPAGTFDTYRVEGGGYIHQVSGLRRGRACDRDSKFRIWVAPEQVTRFVAEDYTQRGAPLGCSVYYANTRTELVAFGRDTDAGTYLTEPRGHHSQIRERPQSGFDDY